MQLNIKNDEAYHLAKELSDLTGANLTTAVTSALRETLDRERRRRSAPERFERIMEMGRQFAALTAGDTRTADEILGYDENGLPT